MKTYRVSEFAEIGGVTAKTLRYYDEIGLLKPSMRDSRSGYRLYTAKQVAELSYILNLRQLGLSIEEIVVIRSTREGFGARTLDVLRAKTEAEVTRARTALALLDTIERQQNPKLLSVITRHQRPQRIAGIRARLGSYGDAVELQKELRASLPRSISIVDRGVLWHGCADSGALEAEAFVCIADIRGLPGRLEVRTLPATRTAAVYCPNDDEPAERGYDDLRTWMKIHSYQLAGPKIEIEHGDTLQIEFPFAAA